MIAKDDLFDTGDKERIWQKYCGFLDLSLIEFMEIQEQLLMDQIDLVYNSPLAKKFMPEKPKDIAEFRKIVPLTTYSDYAPYLNVKNDNVLATRPYFWARTSGRGGAPKWIPYTEKAAEILGRCGIAAIILACTNKKGEVNIGNGLRALHNMPPPPYVSGILLHTVAQQIDTHLMPAIDQDENQDFADRIRVGFGMALRDGVDVLSSLSSVLMAMGDRFAEGSGQLKLNRQMLHPQIMWRLLLAWLSSKRADRTILPKDIWHLKGILAYGMDTDIYQDKLIYYWGKKPLVTYGAAESGPIATPAWNKKCMTFFPLSSFREFVPEAEWLKSRDDKDYQPSTILLDEVKPGERYEVIITNFYGMPLLRYRIGDLIKVVALEDKETGIKLPQIVFESRADDLIDISGFPRLDEKTIWQAIANTGIKYEEWSARKEKEGNKPIVRIYIELKQEVEVKELERLIHQELVTVNQDYGDLENMIGIRPLRVTLLPAGAFQQYYEQKKRDGAELSHLKPPHMNASDHVIQNLLGAAQNS
jgi:phenylacetate-coenzyme A ligase PaaK-like adenylate-forming protein